MRSFDYRWLEDCLWDGEVVSLLSQIHEYKGRQDLFVSQRPSSVARLVDIAKVQSVESSNRIEGIVTTKARIRSLVADKTTPRNRDEEEIMGYRDVLNTIHENYEYIDLTRQIILQLHRDLYAYSHKSIGGQFKNVQNSIIERLADGSERERFRPLSPYETPAAIDDFCHSINAVLQDKSVNPLLVIPVFIHDFLCIHPFNDGNGRMSRLLTTLLLYQNGYMIGKFISLEQKIERTKDSYYAVLAQSGAGWHTGDEDVVPFVKYMLRVILAAYRDFESRIELLTMSLSAKDRIKIIISATIGKVTKSGILEKQPDIAVSTVEKALKEL
ncbi:MAG: Fic family protein [Veillonella sp.]|nr:Fic family protein [Veillonella sp.]MDU4514006.1 Fic family protein [Veillonella sp.]